ncbi:MAG: DUF2179 domain-containing protein [Bacteroidia bacterium]|nr:DUF2179 domain-containing protein [Bacteroidia bacterium]
MDSTIIDFVLLPLMIFFARIIDVSLGTLRIVMIAKGQKRIAPILGFFEVLIWLIAIGRIMQNLDNWICYIAYAGGYATGNYVGMLIEEKLAVGIVQLQIITVNDSGQLINALKVAGYGITHHNALGGASGNLVNVIYSVVLRTDVSKVVTIIEEYNPNAFYSIGDVRSVNKGLSTTIVDKYRWWRVGK